MAQWIEHRPESQIVTSSISPGEGAGLGRGPGPRLGAQPHGHFSPCLPPPKKK